jgi:hypothetical protein
LNTGLEIMTVRCMHKELREKKRRINAATTSPTLRITAYNMNNRTKANEDAKKEWRGIKMVILNGVFNFVLRAPDMLFWLKNNSTWSIFKSELGETMRTLYTYMPGFLSMIADIGYLTYILTFVTNFVIFYQFNKNFKEAVVFYKKYHK